MCPNSQSYLYVSKIQSGGGKWKICIFCSWNKLNILLKVSESQTQIAMSTWKLRYECCTLVNIILSNWYENICAANKNNLICDFFFFQEKGIMHHLAVLHFPSTDESVSCTVWAPAVLSMSHKFTWFWQTDWDWKVLSNIKLPCFNASYLFGQRKS